METNVCYINVQSDGADTNIGIGTIMTDGATMSQKQNKKRFNPVFNLRGQPGHATWATPCDMGNAMRHTAAK